MKIELTENSCKKSGSSLDEALVLICLHNVRDPLSALKECIRKGLVSKRPLEKGYFLTNKGSGLLTDIISKPQGGRDVLSLAKQLKEIYPKGTKTVSDKKYYWTDSPKLIERRLNVFFKLYGQFNDEDIIDATKRYVASFKGDYETMKLLRYFIFRERSFGGINEPSSDLLNFIENKGEDMNNNTNWTMKLI